MGFTQVDELIKHEHTELRTEDTCYFLREYKSSAGFKGETNSLIWNLKKKPSEKVTKPGWHYKEKAIQMASVELRNALNQSWLNTATLVPIPGSKALDHPDYDDRMEQICNGIRAGLDVRCLVKQKVSIEATHILGDGARTSVSDLIENYEVDENIANPAPISIGIFDDVLTVGRHYRAMHTVLSMRFPTVPITGIFIARAIHSEP